LLAQIFPRAAYLSKEKLKAAEIISEIDHLISNLLDLTRPVQALHANRFQKGRYQSRHQRILAVKGATENTYSTPVSPSPIPDEATEATERSTARQPPPLDDHSARSDDYAIQDFKNALKRFTMAGDGGHNFVLVSSLTTWLKSRVRVGNVEISQAARLLGAAYAHEEDKLTLPINEKQLLDKIDGCLLIFSILLEIGHGELIHRFMRLDKADKHLPVDLYSLRSICQGMKLAEPEKLAMSFDQLQWKYCPVILDLYMDREFPRGGVLPFSRKVPINQKGSTAQLYQIEVLAEFVSWHLKDVVKGSGYELDDGLGPVCDIPSLPPHVWCIEKT
jgi:hypothetical protein